MFNFNQCATQNGVLTISCLQVFFQIAVSTALGLVGTVSLFLIIAAGIKFITSGGGKQVDEAKNMLTYAIIGLVIVLSAFFIIGLISGITGVKCILYFTTTGCQ